VWGTQSKYQKLRAPEGLSNAKSEFSFKRVHLDVTAVTFGALNENDE
jgi:hypothetical protein